MLAADSDDAVRSAALANESFDAARLLDAAMIGNAPGTQPAGDAAPVVSPADEIRKLYELLEMGAITQGEFDAAKARLLALL